MKLTTALKSAALVLAAATAASTVARSTRGMRVRGKTALVCGASRGLGRAIALELGRRGAHVAICARTAADLDDVRAELFAIGATVHAEVCDLRSAEQVEPFITSIGGKIGVPHLVPYSTAKFAEVGFAEGLRAEGARDGVHVLTVVPGLMRTGGHVHATFKGDSEKEYGWFGIGATSPAPMTIDAARAARRVVRAIERGDREIVLTAAAQLAVKANAFSPSLLSLVMKVAGRFLPAAPALPAAGLRKREGIELERSSASKTVAFVKARGHDLAKRNHQLS